MLGERGQRRNNCPKNELFILIFLFIRAQHASDIGGRHREYGMFAREIESGGEAADGVDET